MNDNNKFEELITLCKSELSKLRQEEQTINKSNEKLLKKLFKLIKQNKNPQTTMISNEDSISFLNDQANEKIEMRRNTPTHLNINKFLNVITERDNCGKSRAEITAYDPKVELTLLNSQNHLVNITECEMIGSGFLMLKADSSVEATLLENVEINSIITNNKDNGESIISTCEEHLTTQLAIHLLQQSQINNVKPKSQSSTTSLLNVIKQNSLEADKILNRIAQSKQAKTPKSRKSLNKSVTFYVDNASTPKRQIPRSSTPKRLKMKSSTLKKTKKIASNSTQKRNEPFSSTLLSNIAANFLEIKQQQTVQKTIPPPLLSSSVNNSAYLKPKVSNCQLELNKLMYKVKKSSSKKFKTVDSSSCSKCQQCRHQMNKRKSQNLDEIVARNVRKKLKYETSFNQDIIKPKMTGTKKIVKSTSSNSQERKLSWNNLKYPIKFYPNMKSQDIDRLNTGDDCAGASYEYQIKPILKSSYSYGEQLRVWII